MFGYQNNYWLGKQTLNNEDDTCYTISMPKLLIKLNTVEFPLFQTPLRQI